MKIVEAFATAFYMQGYTIELINKVCNLLHADYNNIYIYINCVAHYFHTFTFIYKAIIIDKRLKVYDTFYS